MVHYLFSFLVISVVFADVTDITTDLDIDMDQGHLDLEQGTSRPDSINDTEYSDMMPESTADFYTERYEYRDETISFDCPSDLYVFESDYKWQKHGEDIVEGKKYKVNKEDGRLTISNLNRDDAGTYTTTHTEMNADGVLNKHLCVVEYEAAPLVLDMPRSINVHEGEDTHIDCAVKGWPTPQVTWLKNGVKMKPNLEKFDYEKFRGVEGARMIFIDLKVSDAGDYTCRASTASLNETDEKTTKLRVKYKFDWIVPLAVLLGQMILLPFLIAIQEKTKKKGGRSSVDE